MDMHLSANVYYSGSHTYFDWNHNILPTLTLYYYSSNITYTHKTVGVLGLSVQVNNLHVYLYQRCRSTPQH